MSPELMKIADAVVTALNAADLGQTFTAERLYQPSFELPDLATLRVSVVPRTKESVRLTRARNVDIYKVDIGVMKKFNSTDDPALNAELDPLVKLVDDIADLFDGERLADANEAMCTAKKPDPIYAPEHMEKFRQFTSILSLEFKVF